MGSRQSFAETLEEALGTAQDDTPKADRFVYLPASAAPFVFVYSRPAGAGLTGAATTSASAASARRAYAPTAVSSPVTAPAGLMRALTPRQQRAFDAMVALGAGLRGDFDATDLRRAFKQLARAYHPDRHPDCSEVEFAHLSRTFAELSNHYRCLLAIFERAESR